MPWKCMCVSNHWIFGCMVDKVVPYFEKWGVSQNPGYIWINGWMLVLDIPWQCMCVLNQWILASKLRAVESGSPKKVPGKGAFQYINYYNSGTFFGLRDSTARNFEASWGRKELHTSKESPITCRLKEVLKLEESLSWKAPAEF